MKFQEVADASNSVLNRICPRCVYRPMQYILIFGLFHLYLLYAIIYAVTQLVTYHTKVKGSRVILMLPNFVVWKEKIIVFVTSIFIWHWFSSSILGVSAGWHHFSSWILNLRPQINIKPQLKVFSATESCPSTKSNISLSVDEVDTDVDLYLTPKNKELAGAMKKLEMATNSASFASDLVSSIAGSISRSNSIDSAVSLGSYSDGEGVDEVDLDEEMEKFNFAEPITDDCDENKPLLGENGKDPKETSQFRMSLREVANEVLTKISIASNGFRSKIPRPIDKERFNTRNAAANSALRKRFLKRNVSPGFEECSLFADEDI
ncbi:hypothetical protein RB195_020327 [Necator americanus]